jgi:hypothetical protein
MVRRRIHMSNMHKSYRMTLYLGRDDGILHDGTPSWRLRRERHSFRAILWRR